MPTDRQTDRQTWGQCCTSTDMCAWDNKSDISSWAFEHSNPFSGSPSWQPFSVG